MNISLELYRIFDAVAQARSFSAAARALYISQPAVSQAIRQLEDALGAKLFTRGARGIALTAEGELLRGYIHSALGLIEAGENRILNMNELFEGALRIGAGDTVAKWFLLPLVEEYHARYPEVSLSITNRTSPEILELLHNGSIDVGFVNMPLASNGVIFESCSTLHDTFVAGEKYLDLKDRVVSLEELASKPLIMLERASNSRSWVDRHFLENGIALKPSIELGSHDLLADYARIGLGVACVISEYSSRARQDGLFELTLDRPVPARNLGACYLEGISLSAATRRFIELAKL